MAKFKSKVKDLMLLVRVKLSAEEEINERELDIFSHNFIRGFLRPAQSKKNLLEFTGLAGIPLYDYLKEPISQFVFFLLIEQIIEITRKTDGKKLSPNKIVFDLKNVYINKTTKELQFIYLPVKKAEEKADVLSFIEQVIYSVHPMQEQNSDYLTGFSFFIKSLRSYAPDEIEKYISAVDRKAVNLVKKQSAPSGFLTDKQKDYYEHYAGDGDDGRGNDEQDCDESENDHDKNGSGDLYDDDATGLLYENDDDDDDPTGLLYENDDDDNDATGLLCGSGDDDDDATGLLCGSGDDDDDATGLLCGSDDDDDDATGILYGGDDDGDDATGLLCEDNESIRRREPPTQKKVHYPSVYRIFTAERISINKPVFRIGKEKSYVDYFVANNNAVSRSHADIITRGSRCFIVDLNSKNRTYVNGYAIPVRQEVEIFDNDRLRLANEEFIFNF